MRNFPDFITQPNMHRDRIFEVSIKNISQGMAELGRRTPPSPYWFLADKLTLSQPEGGGQIMPNAFLIAHYIFSDPQPYMYTAS
jgi:hypothetical protein